MTPAQLKAENQALRRERDTLRLLLARITHYGPSLPYHPDFPLPRRYVQLRLPLPEIQLTMRSVK